jgi:hypothetical protein
MRCVVIYLAEALCEEMHSRKADFSLECPSPGECDITLCLVIRRHAQAKESTAQVRLGLCHCCYETPSEFRWPVGFSLSGERKNPCRSWASRYYQFPKPCCLALLRHQSHEPKARQTVYLRDDGGRAADGCLGNFHPIGESAKAELPAKRARIAAFHWPQVRTLDAQGDLRVQCTTSVYRPF